MTPLVSQLEPRLKAGEIALAVAAAAEMTSGQMDCLAKVTAERRAKCRESAAKETGSAFIHTGG